MNDDRCNANENIELQASHRIGDFAIKLFHVLIRLTITVKAFESGHGRVHSLQTHITNRTVYTFCNFTCSANTLRREGI